MTRCVRCGGKMVNRRVDLAKPWGDEWYVVRNVPAHVCGQCGEECFDAKVLMRVDELREAANESGERVEVTVFDFAKAGKPKEKEAA